MKLNLSARFLMLALLCGSCVLNTPKEELEYNGMNTLQISNVDDLISFYQYADDRIPLISGHRGGRGKGYPENSMETFENTLSYTPATFEIDPRLTKDSVIVLFHDDTLERTSNGTGKVSDYTWEELQNFRLKDPEGNITNYRIPTLEEAIRWARGKTILILDKKDVPMERTAQLITDMQAEPYVMITVHDGASARFFYEKNPNFMFEAFVKKGALNSLLTVLLCCGAGGVLSNLTVLIGLGHHADLISIGNIMLLIPGIAFTNSLRDMFSGDTITGLIRCMEALLLALVVGLGFTVANLLF